MQYEGNEHVSCVPAGQKPSRFGVLLGTGRASEGAGAAYDVYAHTKDAVVRFCKPHNATIIELTEAEAAISFALSLTEIDGARDFLECWREGADLARWPTWATYRERLS